MERPPGCGVDGGDCNRYMPPPPSTRNVVNSKVMVVAVVVLFAVVVFILCLHIYAKWFWRHHGVSVVAGDGTIRTLSWRRRRYRGDANVQNGTTVTQSVGLDRAFVEALPSFVYGGGDKNEKEEGQGVKECVVCLEEFEDGERGRTLPKCGHGFHLECIDMWLHSHSTCPLCRTSVGEDEEEGVKGEAVVEIDGGAVVGDVGAPFMAAMRQHRRSRSRSQVVLVSNPNSLPRTEEGIPVEESNPVPVDERDSALQQSLKEYETANSSGSSIRAPFQVTIDIPRGGTNNPVSNSLSPMARASASFRRLLSRGKSVVTPQSPSEAADEGEPSSSPRPPPPPPSV